MSTIVIQLPQFINVYNCLEEQFFSLNIMLRLNKSERLETIEKLFHLNGYNTVKSPGRN